jgi:hypothetical protein
LVLKPLVAVAVGSMQTWRVAQEVPVVEVDLTMSLLALEVRVNLVRVSPEVTQLDLDLATSPRAPVVVALEEWARASMTPRTAEETVVRVHSPTFSELITSSVVVAVVAHTTGQPRANAVEMVAPVVVAQEAYWEPVQVLPKAVGQL